MPSPTEVPIGKLVPNFKHITNQPRISVKVPMSLLKVPLMGLC